MDTLQNIEQRIINGEPVTDVERSFYLRNNPRGLAAFMVANNPASVRDILKRLLGYTHLSFDPNRKQLLEQLRKILERNDAKSWGIVVENFTLRTDGLSQEFINALSAQFAQ